MTDPGPETAAELSDSLTLGFLALLDQLAPVERAVFVLADVFDVPYAQIATTVGRSQAACRQIASRARRRLRRSPHADQPGRIRLALSIAVRYEPSGLAIVAFVAADTPTDLHRVDAAGGGGPGKARPPVAIETPRAVARTASFTRTLYTICTRTLPCIDP